MRTRTISEGHYSVYLSRCKEHISPKYSSRRKVAPAERPREKEMGEGRGGQTHTHTLPAAVAAASWPAGQCTSPLKNSSCFYTEPGTCSFHSDCRSRARNSPTGMENIPSEPLALSYSLPTPWHGGHRRFQQALPAASQSSLL